MILLAALVSLGSSQPAAAADPGFSSDSYEVQEGAESVAVTVHGLRPDPIVFATDGGTPSDGSAVGRDEPGSGDYLTVSTTMVSDEGGTSRVLEVPINDDNDVESRESFAVHLGYPNGSNLAHARVEILDNEGVAYATTAGDELFSFPPSDPAATSPPQPITGLAPGEDLLGIDFRPSTSELYGLGSSSRLYVIDRHTAAATPVGNAGTFTLSGAKFGFDFMGQRDQIRLISDEGQHLRLNPDDGTVIASDGDLFYPYGDLGFGADPVIVAATYTHTYPLSLRLVAIDAPRNGLVESYFEFSEGPEVLRTIGALKDSVGDAAIDAQQFGPTVFAAVTSPAGATSRFALVDTDTGRLRYARPIGVEDTVTGLALGPPGQLELVADDLTVSEADGAATLTVNRSFGTVGAVSTVWSTVGSPGPGVDGAGRVHLADGATSATFDMTFEDDPLPEPDRQYIVRIGFGSNGGVLADPLQGPRARVTILDDDEAVDPVQNRELELDYERRRLKDGRVRVRLIPELLPCPDGGARITVEKKASGAPAFKEIETTPSPTCQTVVRTQAARTTLYRARSSETAAFHASTSNVVRVRVR